MSLFVFEYPCLVRAICNYWNDLSERRAFQPRGRHFSLKSIMPGRAFLPGLKRPGGISAWAETPGEAKYWGGISAYHTGTRVFHTPRFPLLAQYSGTPAPALRVFGTPRFPHSTFSTLHVFHQRFVRLAKQLSCADWSCGLFCTIPGKSSPWTCMFGKKAWRVCDDCAIRGFYAPDGVVGDFSLCHSARARIRTPRALSNSTFSSFDYVKWEACSW